MSIKLSGPDGSTVGAAAVPTVLVSRAGEIAGAADPAARGLVAANAFHGAAWVMFVVAARGALTAAIAGGPDEVAVLERRALGFSRTAAPGRPTESLAE